MDYSWLATYSEDELRRIASEALSIAWERLTARVTAQHGKHDRFTLYEGCLECLPGGERVGG